MEQKKENEEVKEVKQETSIEKELAEKTKEIDELKLLVKTMNKKLGEFYGIIDKLEKEREAKNVTIKKKTEIDFC